MIRNRSELAKDRALLRKRSGGSGPNLMPRWWGSSLPCGGFDPTTLALSSYYRPDGVSTYAPSSWAGTASAGSSSSYHLQTDCPPSPETTHRAWTAGAPVNGYTPAVSDGFQQLAVDPLEAMCMTYEDGANAFAGLTNFASAGSFSGWALINPTTGGAPFTHTGGMIFHAIDRSDSHRTILKVWCPGTNALFSVAPAGGALTSASFNAGAAGALDTWQLVFFTYDKANSFLATAINEAPGTDPTTITSCSIDLNVGSGDPLQMGMEYFALHLSEQAFAGQILEAATTAPGVILTPTQCDQIRCYARNRYSLALSAP